MKPTLEVAKNEIETEALDHAEETRYAVTHEGRELHPDNRPVKKQKDMPPSPPWQKD